MCSVTFLHSCMFKKRCTYTVYLFSGFTAKSPFPPISLSLIWTCVRCVHPSPRKKACHFLYCTYFLVQQNTLCLMHLPMFLCPQYIISHQRFKPYTEDAECGVFGCPSTSHWFTCHQNSLCTHSTVTILLTFCIVLPEWVSLPTHHRSHCSHWFTSHRNSLTPSAFTTLLICCSALPEQDLLVHSSHHNSYLTELPLPY